MILPDWWKSDKPYIIGDCLEGMRQLPDECVDLVLTDPPFNVGIDYGKYTNDSMDDEQYSDWFKERLLEMERIIKPHHPIIVFSGDKKIHPILNGVEDTDLLFHHFLKWHKPNNQRGLSGFVLFYRTELALLLTKGKPDQKILNRKVMFSDTLIYNNTSPKGKDDICPVAHPCRRPQKLYMNIIEGFSKRNDIVLDPFLGSGTTISSSLLTNRIGLGFEINPEYEQLIIERNLNTFGTPDLGSWFE